MRVICNYPANFQPFSISVILWILALESLRRLREGDDDLPRVLFDSLIVIAECSCARLRVCRGFTAGSFTDLGSPSESESGALGSTNASIISEIHEMAKKD